MTKTCKYCNTLMSAEHYSDPYDSRKYKAFFVCPNCQAVMDGEYEAVKFYRIEDQIIISDKSLTVGTELIANTVDAAQEKHVPVITISDDEVKVAVGSVEHPSLPAHYIEFIVLVTEGGMQMKWLKPGDKPEAIFKITDKPVAAYEYCNLHGLWKAEA